MLNETPFVTEAGAETEKCVAGWARLVREKVVLTEPLAATTLYAPVVAFAVKAGAVATPLAFVMTLAIVEPPANVPDAPEAGALKVTPAPLMGALPPSSTVACSCVGNAVLTTADCGVPA